jgi:tetratricopeptide (TPR) repeat protein
LLFTTRVSSLFTLAADPSFMNRFVFFEAASGMVRDSPLVGVGLEGYGLLYPRYRPVEGERTVLDELPSKVHNGYLQAAVTTGIPGLILYLLLLGAVLVPLWIAAWRRAEEGRERSPSWPWLAAGIFSGLLSYCIQDVSGWHEVSLSLVFWTLLGLGAAAPLVVTAAAPARRWTMPPRHAAVATVGVLAVAAAIAGGAIGTLRMMVADYRLAVLQQLDVMRDWTAAQAHIAAVQRFAPANPYYDDALAVQLLRRVAATRDADAYRAAVELLERSRRNFPFDSYVLVHRIDLDTAAVRSGLIAEASPEARAALDELVRVDPNNSTVHECEARLAMAERRWQDAGLAIDRAIALRPRVAGYRLTRGDIARAQGDLPGQIAAYRAAFAELGPLDAGWRSAGHKLAVTLIEGGQYAEALEIATAMLEQGPDAVTWTLAGAANLGSGARPAAVLAFQRALELDSSNVSARRGLEEAARSTVPAPR